MWGPRMAGHLGHEVPTVLTPRVPRIYIRHGEYVAQAGK